MDVKKFANQWLESWNEHDLGKILEYYSEDIEITSPLLKLKERNELAFLKGKIIVTDYWQNSFLKFPNLNFELLEINTTRNQIIFYYKSIMNKRVIEVMFLNENKLIYKIIVNYFY